MIVEDDFIIRMFIEKVVQNNGFVVISKASCYEDAVQNALETNPDIILMDIGLSGSHDGIDAANKILETLETKIIYLTGNSDEKTIYRAMSSKPIGIIYKPINEELLSQELKKYAAEYFNLH